MIKTPVPYLLFLFALLITGSAFSQLPDTVVVYEYVTDTVWVERETINFTKLTPVEPTLLPVNNSLPLKFYPSIAATISEKSIIRVENKRQSEMKRTGFFTLLLLSVQSLTFGQAEFSVNAGISSMWLEHGLSTISNPMWAGAHFGAELNFPFSNSHLGISVGLSGSFIFPPSSYYQSGTIDESLSYFEKDIAKIRTDVVLNELNAGLFESPFYQIAFPVKLTCQIDRWRPFLGIEYNYTGFIYKIPEQYQQSGYWHEPLDTRFHDFGVKLGTRYAFTNKLSAEFDLTQGLKGKHNYFDGWYFPNLGVKEYYFSSLNVDLSLVYSF